MEKANVQHGNLLSSGYLFFCRGAGVCPARQENI
jgi:hypothetical protein